MSSYLNYTRRRYRQAGKKEKGLILDDFCNTYDYQRKSAIRLLNKPTKHEEIVNKGGRPPKYDKKQLVPPLKRIWFVTDQLCDKLLKEALPLWLKYYEKHYGELC